MSSPKPEADRLLEGGASSPGERAAAELLQRVPQPHPDDIARARIWQGVNRELRATRPPSRALPILVPLAACLVLVIVARVRMAPPSMAHLEMTAGTVLAAAPQHGWSPAEAGVVLPEASRVKTSDSSRAVVSLARSAVLVDPGTDLALDALGSRTFLRMTGGRVVAEVEPRGLTESFEIQTTRYRITVKGTVFSVQERAESDVIVGVSRGLVEVSGDNRRWLVPAGQSWQSRDDTVRPIDTISPPERTLLDGALDGSPRATVRVAAPAGANVEEGGVLLGPAPVSWNAPQGRYHFFAEDGSKRFQGDAVASTGTPALVTLVPDSPPAASAPGDAAIAPIAAPKLAPPPSPGAPTSSPLAVEAHRPSTAVRSGVEAHHAGPLAEPASTLDRARVTDQAEPTQATLDAQPEEGGSSKPSALAVAMVETPPISAPPTVPSAPAAPAPTVSQAPQGATSRDDSAWNATSLKAPAPRVDPYASALSLSRAGQYREAATAFEDIARSSGPGSELALYELARLRQEHMSDPNGALQALLEYQTRFPHGSLEQEVSLSAIELELKRSDLSAARRQMDTFLDRHADSERAPEVHLLRGNLLRNQGDCTSALADYQRTAKSPAAEDGLYYQGWCEQNLGQNEAAADTLADYLKRFPSGRHVNEVTSALKNRQ